MIRNRIVDLIRHHGPIPFERFMELALYHPDGGFFSGAELRSRKGGDFLTSPEVSSLFGETLADFVGGERKRIGEPFRLVEVAGGSGSLLRPLLARRPVEAWAVETAPAARRALAGVVGPDHVFERMGQVPSPVRGVILANELVDNLPMAMAQLEAGSWRERWVGTEEGRLQLVDADPRPEVVRWLERFAGPVEEGGWVEVQRAASAWVGDALERLECGALVVIDYGDTAENLAPRRGDGTLRTYRSHHLGPHPLDEPGATDITADVNFTALEAAAAEAGGEVELWRQDDFLTALGLRRRISGLRHRELELARSGDEIKRLAVRSWRTEAETLLHPRGLGDFRVLVARK
ncbi:MAG TPA: SAM-dependent methyltransferase [Longimicrobiales bacterium]|nr:SAM-dependent methyltransferase [Longimicrobiales bacterium]